MIANLGDHMSESINTPRDYSEDMYRFFFEIVDNSGTVKQMISNFLGEENSKSLAAVAYGYEFDMPIQCAPDLIRLLAMENIGIYQVVRGAKAPAHTKVKPKEPLGPGSEPGASSSR
jgi:hypothetical protein